MWNLLELAKEMKKVIAVTLFCLHELTRNVHERFLHDSYKIIWNKIAAAAAKCCDFQRK